MPRIRSIKPEFWTSAQVLECSTNARLLFVGLWNFCDDLGRHPYSAKQAKAEVFPSDDFTEDQVSGMLHELSKNDLITIYRSDNKEYFYVTGWKHQRIDKPQAAKYPGPCVDNSTTIPGIIQPDRIGEDRKGKDKKDTRASALADIDLDFPEWYEAYPRHEARGQAMKAYRGARKKLSAPELLAAAKQAKQRFSGTDPQFIPLPASWLNGERWADQPAKTAIENAEDRIYRTLHQ